MACRARAWATFGSTAASGSSEARGLRRSRGEDDRRPAPPLPHLVTEGGMRRGGVGLEILQEVVPAYGALSAL